MTGLYVVFSKRRQEQLTSRRNGYRQYILDDGFGYVREEHDTDFLGDRQIDRVRMSDQWIADILSVKEDPHATFFFVDNRHRESVPDAIRRGLNLPLGRTPDGTVHIDRARHLASDLRTVPRSLDE
ncbi:hypothetical protein [Roseicyclus persicicus]|uniref:Uncharacterized protein n=1 Tax=Roseicyclus persicicus TaxID=2650661 RepID=A0A7X6GXZ6_9RHOB|nr:hypothetical protein [Roseibacterium persicicum]NKX44477.1 hypothetical protein [Roseibacterium persicicum]